MPALDAPEECGQILGPATLVRVEQVLVASAGGCIAGTHVSNRTSERDPSMAVEVDPRAAIADATEAGVRRAPGRCRCRC